MKTVYSPDLASTTLRFGWPITRQLITSTLSLASAVQAPRRDVPDLTVGTRLLNHLLEAIERRAKLAELTPDVLLSGVTGFSTDLGRLLVATHEVATQSTMKYLQGMFPNEVVAAAFARAANLVAPSGAGAPASGVITSLTQQTAYDLFFFAAPGQFVPHTEDMTIDVMLRLIGLAERARTWSGPEMPAEARVVAVAQQIVTNLITWALSLLKTPPTLGGPVEQMPNAMFNVRLTEMRKHAAYAIGASLSAHADVAEHYLKWLTHPWVKAATFAGTANLLTRTVEEFQQRHVERGPFDGPSHLTDADLFDVLVVQLPNFQAKAEEGRLFELPEIDPLIQPPMAPEGVGNLVIDESDVMTWTANAEQFIRTTEQAALLWTRFVDTTVSSLKAPISELLSSDTGFIGYGVTNGYPVITEVDEVRPWPATPAAMMTLGLSRWTIYTRQRVLQKVAASGLLPFRIARTTPRKLDLHLPTPVPAFRHLDHTQAVLPPSLETLAQLLKLTPRHLQQLLSHLIHLGTAASPLRGFAEAVRFIGVLTMNKQPIAPFSRCWYHGTSHDVTTFHPPITLLERTGGEPTFQLAPFRFIPSSADLRNFAKSLARLTTVQRYLHLPIAAWMELGETKPSNLEVDGWAQNDEDLADIVFASVTDSLREYYLTGPTDGSPFKAKSFNAALSIGEAPNAAALPAVPTPTGLGLELV